MRKKYRRYTFKDDRGVIHRAMNAPNIFLAFSLLNDIEGKHRGSWKMYRNRWTCEIAECEE